ncbi:MAG: hypothetical protein Q4C91_04985 [Eubacteriales bacterium]|nr:hypothetical protein [Eubacteriales bacterium]
MKEKVYIMLLLLCMVAGCSQNKDKKETNTKMPDNMEQEESDSKVEGAEYSFPDKFEKKSGNVSFQTQIIVNNISKKNIFYKGTAKCIQIDVEKLKERLFEDIDEEVESHVMESTNYVGEKGEIKIWQTASNRTLYSSNVNISYTTPLYTHINQAFTLPERENEDTGYSTTKGFEGFTRKQAWNEIKRILGIQIPEEYICYTLPFQEMEKREIVFDLNGNEDISAKKTDWNENDDTYFFVFRNRYCGLPTYHPFCYTLNKDILENMPLQVAISRKGIEYISLERIFEYETENEMIELVPFEKIAEALEIQLTSILGDQTYTVKSAELKAMERLTGQDSYEMVPIWIIRVETNDSGETYQFQKIFDASTAKELILS